MLQCVSSAGGAHDAPQTPWSAPPLSAPAAPLLSRLRRSPADDPLIGFFDKSNTVYNLLKIFKRLSH